MPNYVDYLQINRLGRVPALTDGAVTMTGSAGMAQYLVDKLSGKADGYGKTFLGQQTSGQLRQVGILAVGAVTAGAREPLDNTWMNHGF